MLSLCLETKIVLAAGTQTNPPPQENQMVRPKFDNLSL